MTLTTSTEPTAQNTADTPQNPEAAAMKARRRSLIRTYRKEPERALIQDGARTHTTRYAPSDPLHAEVEVGLVYGGTMPVGVHRALGGTHDFPNPGDILCGALAACTDSTIRQVADQLDIRIEDLRVLVTGNIDVRGTLCVAADAPVPFQGMDVKVQLDLAEGTPPKYKAKLMMAAEYCCVVLQTLRNGVPVSIQIDEEVSGTKNGPVTS